MASSAHSARARKQEVNRARHDLYRALILDAAEASFARHGVEGARMEQIAEEAGLSLGTVYAVFRGKAAIVDALHATRLREMLERTVQAARGRDDPLARLLAAVRAYVEYFVEHPDYLRMYVAEGTSWGVRSVLAARPGRGEAWEEGIAMQARLFRKGGEAGVFHPGDPDRMARTLVSMQQVRLADWLESGMRDDPEQVIAEMELQLRRSFCARARDREPGDAQRPDPERRG